VARISCRGWLAIRIKDMFSYGNWLDRRTRKLLRSSEAGFTLIELIIVVTIILILVSLAAPIYRNSLIRSREAVLRDDLFTMRSLIDEYTLDRQEAPQSLQDLVDHGYLRQIPPDPFTGASDTWVEVAEDATFMTADQTKPGIIDVHSGSNLKSLAGDEYSSW
jgi:general secretion pathway protein G